MLMQLYFSSGGLLRWPVTDCKNKQYSGISLQIIQEQYNLRKKNKSLLVLLSKYDSIVHADTVLSFSYFNIHSSGVEKAASVHNRI